MTILGAMAFPDLMDRFLARNAVEGQDRDARRDPARDDNLTEPAESPHLPDGAFGHEAQRAGLLLPAGATLLAVGGGALLAAATFGAAMARAVDAKRETEKEKRQ